MKCYALIYYVIDDYTNYVMVYLGDWVLIWSLFPDLNYDKSFVMVMCSLGFSTSVWYNMSTGGCCIAMYLPVGMKYNAAVKLHSEILHKCIILQTCITSL